jgi:hypothetical protein
VLDVPNDTRHPATMSEDAGQGEQIIRRARTVAAGFADVGLTQAEELLRRMSPEGRAQARRERAARVRRHNRLLAQFALALLASLATWVVLGLIVVPTVAMLAAAATMLLLTMVIVARASPGAPGREALVAAALPDLAAEASNWLAAQRRGLPAPALQLADTMMRRLDQLQPQLVRMAPHDPAADALRKLVATELPALVESWRAVPISLRGSAQLDGRIANAQLIDGMQLIDAEVARVADHLARGAIDGITVQGRYLELKYAEDALLIGRDPPHRQ